MTDCSKYLSLRVTISSCNIQWASIGPAQDDDKKNINPIMESMSRAAQVAGVGCQCTMGIWAATDQSIKYWRQKWGKWGKKEGFFTEWIDKTRFFKIEK